MGKFRYDGASDTLVPLLADAEVRFVASVEQVCGEAGGQLGVLEQAGLEGAACVEVLARRFFQAYVSHPSPTSHEAVGLAKTSAQMFALANQGRIAVRDSTVRVAGSRPRPPVDKLAAYLDLPPEPGDG